MAVPGTRSPRPTASRRPSTASARPDGKQWTFDLASLASEGPLDIVLTPGTVEGLPDGANGSTFEISFQPPSSDALTTASSSGESTSVEEGSTTRGGGEVTGTDSAAAGTPGGASAYEAPGPAGADQPQAQPEGGEQQQAAAPPKVQDEGRPAASTADTRRNLVLSGSVLFAILGAVVLTAAAQRQFPTVGRPSRTESAA
jgi:hypothetical protein